MRGVCQDTVEGREGRRDEKGLKCPDPEPLRCRIPAKEERKQINEKQAARNES